MLIHAVVPLVPIAGEERPDPFASLAGRPLCDWAIRAAADAKVFGRIIAIVADPDAAALAKARGAEPMIVDWRAETMDELLVAVGESLDAFDALALVDPACPLLHPDDIAGAVEALTAPRIESGVLSGIDVVHADSVVAVARRRLLVWEPDGTPVNYDVEHRPRPGEWEGELVEVGALYVFTRRVLDDTDSRLGGNIVVHEIPAERSFRIENDVDFEAGAIRARRYGYRPEARRIKMIVLDVDGVLTDQCFYYDEKTEVMKKFNTRDGAGIRMAMDAGTVVGIITGESTGFAPARAAKLGITRVELGCKSKLPVLDAWRTELGLQWDEIAYMGDDLPDLPCVKAAGVGACPNDAEPELRAAADYVSPIDGGRGCVRDFIRYLSGIGRLEVKKP